MSALSSFKQKVYTYQITVLILSLLLVSMVLFVFYSIYSNINTINATQTEIVNTSHRLLFNLQKSFVLLNQWKHEKNITYKNQRLSLWDNKIIPDIEKLQELTTLMKTYSKALRITRNLDKIYNWQWRIENTVHAIGNNPIQYEFDNSIKLIIVNSLLSAENLLKYGRKIVGSSQGNNYIQTIISTQSLLQNINLLKFNKHHNPDTTKILEQINNQILKLNLISGVTKVTSRYINELIKNLKLISQELTLLDNRSDRNVTDISNDWLNKDVSPLVENIYKELNQVQKIAKQSIKSISLEIRNKLIIFFALSGVCIIILFLSVYFALREFNRYRKKPTKHLLDYLSGSEIAEQTKDTDISEIVSKFNELKVKIKHQEQIIQENSLTQNNIINEEQWVRQSQQQIYQIIYKAKNLQNMAREVSKLMCSLYNADLGIFYILNEKKKLLIKYGTFGVAKESCQIPYVTLENSLAGHCVLQKKFIHYNDLPDSYLNNTYLENKKNLTEVLFIPLVLNNRVLGVIELITSDEFLLKHKRCAAILTESIVLAIDYAFLSAKIRHLSATNAAQKEEIITLERNLKVAQNQS